MPAAALALSPTHHDMLGRPVAGAILEEVAAEAARLAALGRPPRLVSMTIGDTAPVEVYVRNQRRAAETAGIGFSCLALPADVAQAQALAEIRRLNADDSVTGIILQRPVPPHLSVKSLQGAILPAKDVEGMHPASIGNIVYGNSSIGPCTALASVEMLRRTGLRLEGLEVVVIGHSEIVGKPIAFLLMAEGATVTVCHHMTRSVAMHSRRADAVFVAVGRPHLIGPDMIKPGAVVIDIGINQITDPQGRSRVVGDVDTDAVRGVAGWITPVPGGVGPVTVAMLMRNAVRAAGLNRPAAVAAAAAVDRVLVEGLDLEMSIGLHPWEMNALQPVRIDLEIDCERRPLGAEPVVCYERLSRRVRDLAAAGHVELVETLAERIAGLCLADPRVHRAAVSVRKTSAIPGTSAVGVKVIREKTEKAM
ncbi:methylenetetrahydrofolate dehydrogenase [Paramagnetospirillum caucaseum]|uniref:Bifunctional protein FolD n=1 Tax=Paramagnetospirillum caucaseum TaxID=1244869 RepID=M3AA57_9PROT|nr:tetrahydrofolate dehydrogenase/cyclohydrolase catalytic domain-containing protein [Paramagnetospirillum caucaseum]EME69628.1 methylenetetrahydrofolate dehydrogenase [Paramagnetospirillum caucaseum]